MMPEVFGRVRNEGPKGGDLERPAAHSLTTRLVVTAALQGELDQALAQLVGQSGALAAALVERSGLTIASTGHGPATHPAVGALVGGIFKSLETLATLLGEQAVREIGQVGEHTVTILTLLDTQDLLVVSFPAGAPAVGRAGFIEAAARALAAALVLARQTPVPPGRLLDAGSIDGALGQF
jgi:predicted regulator of Ras-like GTPase activity (Roadblock/LC7/MglB family)